VHPLLPSNKPDWLMKPPYNGKLPCLTDKRNNMIIADSPLQMAEYIEKQFPLLSLGRKDTFLSYKEVFEKTKDFVPILTAYLINLDKKKDPLLYTEVEKQLNYFDELLRSTPGRYFCGIDLTFIDLYLVPIFFSAMVALDHFKRVEILMLSPNIDPVRPALEKWMNHMFNMKEFNNKKGYVIADEIIYSWKVKMGINYPPV
jgi:glutathione S-transferase